MISDGFWPAQPLGFSQMTFLLTGPTFKWLLVVIAVSLCCLSRWKLCPDSSAHLTRLGHQRGGRSLRCGERCPHSMEHQRVYCTVHYALKPSKDRFQNHHPYKVKVKIVNEWNRSMNSQCSINISQWPCSTHLFVSACWGIDCWLLAFTFINWLAET